MTDQVAEQQVDVVEETVDYKKLYEEAKKAIDALASKKDELLRETKQAKEEKRKAAEIAEQAKQEQLANAQKNGEFEKLWKQEQEEKADLQKELQRDRQERRNERINLAAIKIASDLAKGDSYKAELLSEFVAKSISNVADETGRADDDVIMSVKKQFETDAKYAPLLGGNKSVGGSAPGNTRSTGTVSTLNRAEFFKLDSKAQSEFAAKVRAGSATLTDE